MVRRVEARRPRERLSRREPVVRLWRPVRSPVAKKPRAKNVDTCARCPKDGRLQDPRIQHVIVLMLENRSFDHMLGYSGIPGIDGIPDDNTYFNQNFSGKKVFTSSSAAAVEDLFDPGHDYEDVCTQIYGAHDQPDGAERQLCKPGDLQGRQPSMQGFIRSYLNYTKARPADAENVMRCFAPQDVPVLTTLANEFAVCKQWFSSIPGPTLPNRLFVHAGTSGGRLDMSAEEFNATPTIYEVLDCANVPSTIYADGWTATSTFWNLMKYQNQYFGTLDDFYQDCYDNQLPNYCFIEPRYSSGIVEGTFRPQNDQHPDSDVNEGEHLIYSVYKAIRSNYNVWKSSMLVILYDEHGGLYDHVAPPSAIPPDDKPDPTFQFKFDRYGIRVPAVIVSAYTDHVVVPDRFDHTSVIASARKLLTGHYQDDCLGQRAKHANTFESVLNRPLDKPRREHIESTKIGEMELEFAPRRVDRGEHDKQYLTRPVNDLQIMHLKQALLLNCRLPQGLQVKPASVLGRDLTNLSDKKLFYGLETQKAEQYIQSVKRAAQHAPLKSEEECKKGPAQ